MPRKTHNIPQKHDSDVTNRAGNMFGALSLLCSDDEDNNSISDTQLTPSPVKKYKKHDSTKVNDSKKYDSKKYDSTKVNDSKKYDSTKVNDSKKHDNQKHDHKNYDHKNHDNQKYDHKKNESYQHEKKTYDVKPYATEKDEDTANMYVAPSGGNDEWSYVSKKNKKGRNGYSGNNNNYEKTNKVLFDESTVGAYQLENMGDNIYFNSKWNVSIHSVAKEDWSLESYEHIYSFNNFGRFLRLFNNFHLLDKINNDIFIMRDGVTPIWEDLNNRYGGICSLKIDYYNKMGRNEIGSEIMFCITMLIINESLIRNNQDINGISYSIRNKSIFIKIWVKDYKKDSAFPSRMPLDFLDRVNTVLQNSDTNRRTLHSRSKISVQYKEIVPEYSM
jgi:hypothetical protein